MNDIETLRKALGVLKLDWPSRADEALAALERMEKEFTKRNKTYEEASLIVAENMALRCENNLLKKELKALEALRKPLE